MTVRERLCDLGYEDAVVFESPAYDDAIIGVTNEGRVIYDYGKMLMCLVENEHMDILDAADFIDYNTVRSLSYIPNGPLIVYNLFEEEEKDGKN